MARALIVAAAGLWLGGCSTTGGSLFGSSDPQTTGSLSTPGAPVDDASLLGSDPTDDLAVGKKYFRAGNFGMAEKYFRRAVELHPSDAEAWMDLAAAYDQLRRFDLADRAYSQASGIVGPSAEILNNQGYSYMLRGDYKRARATLLAAQAKDPGNKFVQNNLKLLAASEAQGKAVQ
jgi:Flp pilus assembly protein TadD